MTALGKYQRLECPGLWRAGPDAQRRDVAVSFGNASLVIADGRSSVPLAHWSLPAVQRRNPGQTPAIYSPDADAEESLELDDPDMIEALEIVQTSIRAGRRQPGRVRLAAAGGILAVVVGLAVFWFPGAVLNHATQVVPQAKRAEIGRMILADLAQDGYVTCRAPLGLQALARLEERVLGPGTARLAVLASPDAPEVVALPGGIILLGLPMIETHESPDVAAGHILAADMAYAGDDPLRAALAAAGLRAMLMLLTTGDLPEGSLRGHGAARLAESPPQPDPAALLARFEAAEIPASPYAYARDPTGESTLRLIEADPFRGTAPPTPILSDGDWVSLQGVCTD